MKTLLHLFESNRAWAQAISTEDPEFFAKLSRQQSPQYLWIGCSDSRVPANEIVGLRPGELFVHRNVGNVVVHTDLNCLSVIQYAVDVLKVTDIMVVGHYGCGGVIAALEQRPLGLIDNWLRHIQDVMRRHDALMGPLADPTTRARLLCELNVIEQVSNVCQTSMVQESWSHGRALAVHGWCYTLTNGLLHDLSMRVGPEDDLRAVYRSAVEAAAGRLLS